MIIGGNKMIDKLMEWRSQRYIKQSEKIIKQCEKEFEKVEKMFVDSGI